MEGLALVVGGRAAQRHPERDTLGTQSHVTLVDAGVGAPGETSGLDGGRRAGVATGGAGVGLLTFPQTFGQTDGHR